MMPTCTYRVPYLGRVTVTPTPCPDKCMSTNLELRTQQAHRHAHDTSPIPQQMEQWSIRSNNSRRYNHSSWETISLESPCLSRRTRLTTPREAPLDEQGNAEKAREERIFPPAASDRVSPLRQPLKNGPIDGLYPGSALLRPFSSFLVGRCAPSAGNGPHSEHHGSSIDMAPVDTHERARTSCTASDSIAASMPRDIAYIVP